MNLQYSDDLQTLKVERMGVDGKVQSFDIQVNGPGDVNRVFAAEAISLLGAQANQNFRAQGLETTQAAPVSFSPEGFVVTEIYQRGVLYRRAIFDPDKLHLTVTGVGGVTLLAAPVREMGDLPLVLAKALDVKLPLSTNK